MLENLNLNVRSTTKAVLRISTTTKWKTLFRARCIFGQALGQKFFSNDVDFRIVV